MCNGKIVNNENVFFIVLFSSVNYAQEVNLNDTEYLEYKKGYIKLMLSDEYEQFINLKKDFVYKLPKDLVGIEENFEELISLQISKSKFNSVEEALDLQKKYLEQNKKIKPLLNLTYDMQDVLIDKFGKEVFWDVYYKDLQKSLREEIKSKS